jgi:hypothetical protein
MLKSILSRFQKASPPPAATPAPAAPAAGEPRTPKSKQVLEIPPVPTPAFAANVLASDLVATIVRHIACRYKPHVEQQRIYKPGRRLPGTGDLDTEYEGISATCPAIKQFGMDVAREDGYKLPYRYVSLHHIFAFCCGDPTKCRFFSRAKKSDDDFRSGLRMVGSGS